MAQPEASTPAAAAGGVRLVLAGLLGGLQPGTDEVLDAAGRCFARAGVAHTTVPDIARELGVSRATVYRKAGTVDDIAWALFARDLDRALADVGPDAAADELAVAVRQAAPQGAGDDAYLACTLVPRLRALLGPSFAGLTTTLAPIVPEMDPPPATGPAPATGTGTGDPAPAGASDLRDRLLDAAEACFRRHGLARTTIDDVVREAGVPRATLYRHAGGKTDLVAGVLRREVARFLDRLGAYVATCDGFASIVVDGVLFAVETARRERFGRPLADTLFADDPSMQFDEALAPVRAELWAQVTDFVAPLVEHARATGEARADLTVEDATEWLQRCITSLVDAPDFTPRTRAERRAFLERMLLPAFVPDHPTKLRA